MTAVANADPGSAEVVERVVEPGGGAEQVRPLGLFFPRDVYSLSHIAMPFPMSDSLYGLQPDPTENFGVHLGAFAVRGERGALVLSLDALVRLSSNPFYPYEVNGAYRRAAAMLWNIELLGVGLFLGPGALSVARHSACYAGTPFASSGRRPVAVCAVRWSVCACSRNRG